VEGWPGPSDADSCAARADIPGPGVYDWVVGPARGTGL
jgi:hypothetical protein